MALPTSIRWPAIDRLRVEAAARVREVNFSEFVREASVEKALEVLREARREEEIVEREATT